MSDTVVVHSLKYRPEIDGLRAVAVLAVLASHFGLHYFEGGYVGVDVFFVLSGFLITTIIKQKVESHSFSFKKFYLRRYLRIYPALVVTVLVSLAIAYLIFLPNDLKQLGWSATAANLSFANLYFWQNMGYFDGAAIEKTLLHTWSLSVEEQFYVIFPALFFVIYRFCYSHINSLLSIAFFVSLLIATWGAYEKPTAAFFLPVTRAWELLLGSAIAISSVAIQSIKWKVLFSWLGLGLIFLSVGLYTEQTIFPGLAALLPTIGTALLLISVDRHSGMIYRLLSNNIAIFFGKISYSLYLVHWPIIVFSHYYLMRTPTPIESVGLFVLATLLAYIMWRIVEVPLRVTNKNSTLNHIVLITSLLGVSLFISISFVITDGFKSSFKRGDILKEEKPLANPEFRCFWDLDDSSLDITEQSTCHINKTDKKAQKKLLLLGDSYANHYLTALYNQLNSQDFAIYQLNAGSCPHLIGFYPQQKGCTDFVNAAKKWVEKIAPDTILLSANWWSYSRDRNVFTMLEKTIDYYTKKGIRVVVIGVSPVYTSKVPNIALRNIKNDSNFEKKYFIQFDENLDRKFKHHTESAKGDYFSVYNLLCQDNLCKYGNSEYLYHSDKGHFTYTGSSYVIKELLKAKIIM